MDDDVNYSGRFYDRNGMPISLREWSRLFNQPAYARVAEDTIGFYWVSTVWLGIDHSWPGPHRPVIFETMVFLKGGGPHDIDMVRYCTEDEARAGHEAVCAEIRAKEELVAGRDGQAVADQDEFQDGTPMP